MRSISQCLPLAVLAMFVTACDQATAPTSSPVRALDLRTPNASISDAANGGRLGFYFLPPLVANPGTFDGTFDATLEPYVTICELITETGACSDAGDIMTIPFGGDGPTAVTADALSESYNANWNRPTLDIGKYRLAVRVHSSAVGSHQIRLGFVDLQVISKKKDPVDAGFVPVVKGSPIPFKFRIETGTVGGVRVGGTHVFVVGSSEAVRVFVFDLKDRVISCPTLTWTSSNPGVMSIGATTGVFEAVSVGVATITGACRGVSGSAEFSVVPLPVPDEP
ncbi:MAG TPA: hypothetical protein VFW03_23965 [Gemmatimonadaceae bacterium]|nr:hypothetical protein [Gemmatimonadaceae bacterium]